MVQYSYMLITPLASFRTVDELQTSFTAIKEAGYSGVEINMSRPLPMSPTELRQTAEDAGLTIPSFLTGEAYHDGLCLSSPDQGVRDATVARLVEYVDIAVEFDSIFVVGLLQGFRSDEPDPDIANSRIVDCLRQVAHSAEEKGVEFVIEPVNHLQVGFNNSVAEVRSIIDRVGTTAVRPMVDTIHMNIEETSLTEPIHACGDRLRHVHLCESHGGHLGTGRVDFPAVLQALSDVGYNGFASIKVYRESLSAAAERSLRYLRDCRAMD